MSRKKTVIGLVIIAILASLAFGVFVFKNVTDQPEQTVQQEENIEVVAPPADTNPANQDSSTPQPTVAMSGQFVDGDAVHSGKGTARVVVTDGKPILTFSEDFAVTSGPDLFVYLSPNPPGQDLGAFASLGRLKSDTGEQAYNLPDNYKDYKTVVIWCRAFSVTFATAELTAN